MTIDILNCDGGVIHQDTDGQRQSSQGHDVEALPQGAQDNDRAENRKRNGDSDNQGIAPVSQEQENHEPGEAGGDQGFAQHTVNGSAYEQRLIKKRSYIHALRQGGSNALEGFLDVFDDIECGGPAVFHHGQQRAAQAVGAHHVGLGRETVAHLRHITDIGGDAVLGLYGQGIDFRNRVRTAVHRDLVLQSADLGRTRGKDQVLGADRVHHVNWGEPFAL